MADEPQDKPTPTPEVKDEGFNYAKDHNKSIRVIAHEEREKARKAKEVEVKPDAEEKPDQAKTEEPRPDDKAPAAETPRAESLPDKPAVEDKEDKAIHNQRLVEEAADKAAAKATEQLKAEIARVEQSKTLTKEEKQEKRDELKSKWNKEGRTPKDYDEIWEEASNAGFEKAKEWFTQQEAAKTKAATEKTAAELAAQEARQKQENDYRSSVEKMTMDEFEELKSQGVVSDEDQKALFETGLKVNTDRMAKGLPPIISIARIYYNHYKPSQEVKPKQPAGADAPIAGKASPKEESAKEQGYNYARDHNKSFRQLVNEITGRK